MKLFVLFLIFLAVVSCSKDEPTYREENFLAGYLQATGYDQNETRHIDGIYYEQGLDFIPLVNGKLTTLKVKLPEGKPDLRISIWDKAANTVIRTEFVNVAAAHTEFTFDITDLELVKGKAYGISMSFIDPYKRSRSDETPATYPLTVGNIQINASTFIKGESQTYPIYHARSSYAGDLSFDFIQTN